jgi:acetoacetate decarboxylase
MSDPLSGLQPGQYLWMNARVLTVEVTVSRAAATSLLPAALEPSDPSRATLFVADYPETGFGSVYREAGVLLHARDAQGEALHCSWMVVDEDAALILGRELLGFPKKMAEIHLEESGVSVLGSVTRKGTELLRIEAELQEDEAHPAPLFGRRVVNAIGTPITGMKLVDVAPAAETIHASRLAEAKVMLASSDRDAFGGLTVPPTAPARYVRLDFGSFPAPQPQLLGDVEAEWTERRFYPRSM